MATKRFVDESRRLAQMVGGGKMRIRVVFDQPYAAIQHEDMSFYHPRGGGPKYLTQALMSVGRRGLQGIADTLFTEGMDKSMARLGEEISDEASSLAPIDFNDLRRSGQVAVFAGGSKVYDRPPQRKRLTEAELEYKDELRGRI